MSHTASKAQKPLPLRLVFARNIRLYRIHLGMSQERLAAEAGLDRAFVGTLERGQRNISIDNIELLCKAVGLPAHEMLDVELIKKQGLDPSIGRSARTSRHDLVRPSTLRQVKAPR